MIVPSSRATDAAQAASQTQISSCSAALGKLGQKKIQKWRITTLLSAPILRLERLSHIIRN
jgi:hypothetical protein